MVVVGAISGLQSGVQLKRVWQKQDKQDNLEQDKKDKKDNLKQDKDELELGLWMLQLHAEGDGNSVRAGGCDIHILVGYYAMLCKLYSKIKMCEYEFLFGGRCKEEALQGSNYCILHVDLPEDEKSDIRDFHVGCIHCNIRTEIYEIIYLYRI